VRKTIPIGILALFLFLAGRGWAAPIRLESIPPADGASDWTGCQIVQADRNGNVFVLRGDTLQVYPIRKPGVLGEPVKLTSTAESLGMVRDAALSPGGDQWLLLADQIRYFVRGKEKPLPPFEWSPWSIGFLRDTPVVALIPRPFGRARDLSRPIDVPWLVKLGSDRWDTLTALQGVDVNHLFRNGGMNPAIAENAVFLTSDRLGRLWAARQYAYLVQQFGPGGRRLLELDVDGGKVRQKETGKGIEIKLSNPDRNPTEATRNPKTERKTFYPFTAEAALLDLVEGRDGRMYFLVKTQGGGTALDRFDPARTALERIDLSREMKGAVNMAAGRDGLYIAPWSGEQGRWRIRWENLDAAAWKAVENARLDGLPLEEQKDSGR
jgi:hypothetical protein